MEMSMLTKQSVYSTPQVSVFVGPERQMFTAHEGILERNAFFRSCIQWASQEESSEEIALPEDEPDVFVAILNYLYGQIVIAPKCDGEKRTDEERQELRLLVRTYIAADKYGMTELKDKLMDSLVHHHRDRIVDPGTLFMFGDMTDCPMQKFLIGEFVWALSAYSFDYLCERDPGYQTLDADQVQMLLGSSRSAIMRFMFLG